MFRNLRLPLASFVLLTFGIGSLASSLAQRTPTSASTESSDSAEIENAGAAVEIDGMPIFLVYASIGTLTPQERAEAIQQRIVGLSVNTTVAVQSIHVDDRGTWSEIRADNDRIMGVTEADARTAERPRAELATEYAEIIRNVVKQYREEHTWRRLLWDSFYALLATAALVTLLVSFYLIQRSMRTRLDRWLDGSAHERAPPPPYALRLWRYGGPPFSALLRGLSWLFILGLIQAYVTVVLRFFPTTRYASYRVTNWLFSAFANLAKTAIGYLPSLMLVVLIGFATFYLIKLNDYFFAEIRDGTLAIRGFYPDWARPTAQLVRLLIFAAAAIVAFPYLPGSESPAFKGISVFLGVLLSLGSTSAAAHGVAGTILTYMRAFQVGDFVRIGGDVGEVMEKTFLVTRIRTQKKEVVTIPNGTVLGGVVVNYSAEARTSGVIFHTVVTIGYSAPWRQVHELLVSAALATDDILQNPAPFVLQTALNDFYVAYELNSYTANPRNMQTIYSQLHQNIQDKFNEAGVEINSPHYTSLRDGNRTTIPNEYLPANYKKPAFEVQAANGFQKMRTTPTHLTEKGV